MKILGIFFLLTIPGFLVAQDSTYDYDEFPQEEIDTSVYDFQELQEIALYIGGDDSLNRFVRSELPVQRQLNYTNKMRFAFIVNLDSTIENIQLVTNSRNIDPYAKSAVIQALKLTSGSWIPALMNGEPVRSRRIVEIQITW